MDFSINKKVIDTLKPQLDTLNISIKNGWYDANLNKTHCTFITNNEDENDYSDDENTSVVYLVQVDLWGKANLESIAKLIKSIMKANGFIFQDGANIPEILEDKSCLYHNAQRFQYYNYLNS